MSIDTEHFLGLIRPFGYHDTLAVVERPPSAISGLMQVRQSNDTIGWNLPVEEPEDQNRLGSLGRFPARRQGLTYARPRRASCAPSTRGAAAKRRELDLCVARKGELCGAVQIAHVGQIIDKRLVW